MGLTAPPYGQAIPFSRSIWLLPFPSRWAFAPIKREKVAPCILLVLGLSCRDSKTEAAEIFSNLNNHFYGRVASGKTAQMLSQQFGKIDEVYTTRSRVNTDLWKENHSESLRERDMMRSNVFLQLGVGEFAGVAVESEQTMWRGKLQCVKRGVLHPIEVSDTPCNFDGYFEQVKADINDLLGVGQSYVSVHEQPLLKDSGREKGENIFQGR